MNALPVICRALVGLVLALCLVACQPPRLSPQQLQARYDAHAHESISALDYMGSKGAYHYFHHHRLAMMKTEYRVARADVNIHDEFPLTDDPRRWRRCRLLGIDGVGTGGILLIPARELDWGAGAAPVIDGIPPREPRTGPATEP